MEKWGKIRYIKINSDHGLFKKNLPYIVQIFSNCLSWLIMQYYTDPVSHYTFRTLKSAVRYVETEELTERAFIQKTSVHEVYNFDKSTDLVTELPTFSIIIIIGLAVLSLSKVIFSSRTCLIGTCVVTYLLLYFLRCWVIHTSVTHHLCTNNVASQTLWMLSLFYIVSMQFLVPSLRPECKLGNIYIWIARYL